MRKELNDLINTGLINEDRMINDIAKIIYDHKKAEKAIDKKLIERIVDVYLENEIPVVDDVQVCLGNIGGAFAREDKTLYINFDFNYMYSKISGKHSKKYYNVSNIGNKQFFRYFDFLTVVFHELTHARFTYLAYDNRKDYPILHSCFENLVLSNSIYQEHHDLFPEERYCNITGSRITHQILSSVYKDKDLIKFPKLMELEYLLDYYDLDINGMFLSPLEGYNETIMSYNRLYGNDDKYKYSKKQGLVDITGSIPSPEEIKELSLYEKMFLGTTILQEEYDAVDDIIYNECYNGLDDAGMSVRETLNKIKK